MNQLLCDLRRRRAAPGAGRRPAPGKRWHGWARSLAARHRRTGAAGSFPGMVLLRRAGPAGGDATRPPSASHAWHLHLTLLRAVEPAASASTVRRGAQPAPRVHPGQRALPTVAAMRPPYPPSAAVIRPVAVLARVSAGRRRTVWLPPAGGSAWLAAAGGAPVAAPAAARTAVPRLVTGDTVAIAVRDTVRRVRERGRRVEERIAAMPAAPHGGSGWAPGSPPMAVTRQPPRREHGGGPAHGRDPATVSLPGQPGPRRAQDAPPRIDVEQLADQVVRRIDDRIIAHRERLGRI